MISCTFRFNNDLLMWEPRPPRPRSYLSSLIPSSTDLNVMHMFRHRYGDFPSTAGKFCAGIRFPEIMNILGYLSSLIPSSTYLSVMHMFRQVPSMAGKFCSGIRFPEIINILGYLTVYVCYLLLFTLVCGSFMIFL